MSVDDADLQRLLSSATLVLAGVVLGSASKLIERVIVARWLSPDAFGEISLALAIMSFAVTLSMAGFNQGVPRYASRFDDERDVRGVWLTGLLIPGTIGVALLALFAAFGTDVVVGLVFEQPDSDRLLLLFLLALPFVVGQLVAVGVIRGLENTRYKIYTQNLFYPGVRIVLLVALLAMGFGVFAAGLAYLVAAVLAFLFAHLMLARLVPLLGRANLHSATMLKFSAPLIVATVLSRLLTWTDTLMLGYFRSSYEVGLYSAAYPLANGLVLMFGAFGFLYLPLTSRLDASGRREAINEVFQLTTKWIYVVTFPAFLALAVFPGDVITIVFDPRYEPASLALTILAVGFFVHAATGRNRETLSALGVTKYVFLSNAVGFAINVALNLALIPRFGIVGAAVASASSYALLNFVVTLVLKLGFDITPLSSTSVRTFVLLPLVLLPPAVVLSTVVTITAVTLPLLLVVAAVATVVVFSVGGCLQPEDRVLLEFVEGAIGRPVPVVRRFLPEGTAPEE